MYYVQDYVGNDDYDDNYNDDDDDDDNNNNNKVKFSLEQATKAQRGSRGIALLFL